MLSDNDFEQATQLISLYLQMPAGLNDAVELMESQCQHLVGRRNYGLLPHYLSFLSDLLGRAKHRDSEVEGLLALADRALNPDGGSVATLESERTAVVREVAVKLCADILGELRNYDMSARARKSLLYNAAKLLPDEKMADLSATIYLKLYDLAEGYDGSCVWAVYNAWSQRAGHSGDLSLEDAIALTTYSNNGDEGDDGRFARNPRNYLISSRTRNAMIGMLAQSRSWQSELFVVYAGLEIHRLNFLARFTGGINEFLKDVNDFDRMAWLTFLNSHLGLDSGGGPFWQQIQRIESHQAQIKSEMNELIGQLRGQGVVTLPSFEERFNQLSYRVQEYLVSWRIKGKEIITLLTERIRTFELNHILGEVQSQLEGHERSLDFSALLELWTSDHDDGDEFNRFLSSDASFLNRDPSSLVQPLVENASRLIDSGKPDLAERLYRYALMLCGVPEGEPGPNMKMVLAGLSRSLAAQGKSDETQAWAAGLASYS